MLGDRALSDAPEGLKPMGEQENLGKISKCRPESNRSIARGNAWCVAWLAPTTS